MNYAKIKTNCTSNGIGIRVALFVSGCPFHCKNCQNQELWNPNYGKEFTDEVKNKMFKELEKSYYDGLTILGGEALAEYNVEEVTLLAKEFKERFGDKKDLWLYTGNVLKDIKDYEILKYIDVLVDGLFVEELYSPLLKFRGSSNQVIYDIQETLRQGKPVKFYEED